MKEKGRKQKDIGKFEIKSVKLMSKGQKIKAKPVLDG